MQCSVSKSNFLRKLIKLSKTKIDHLTTVHTRYDTHIFAKMCKSLTKEFNMNEFEELIRSEGHSYLEYANWDFRYKIMNSLRNTPQKLLNKNVSPYS